MKCWLPSIICLRIFDADGGGNQTNATDHAPKCNGRNYAPGYQIHVRALQTPKYLKEEGKDILLKPRVKILKFYLLFNVECG